MFDESLFTYDAKKHLGYYKGVLIPSVTQLLELFMPISGDIPLERLEKAAKRGTDIHADIERINNLLAESVRFGDQYAIDYAVNMGGATYDYMCLMKVFNLIPLKYEELVFLLDEMGEPICYGHFDLIVGCNKTIDPFTGGEAYMTDIKTTSVFDKVKTALQTHAYRVAFNQTHKQKLLQQTFGIWLRDGVKLIPLELLEDNYIIEFYKTLRRLWNVKGKD